MKGRMLVMLLLSAICCMFPHAHAEVQNDRIAYSGDVYPLFQVAKDHQILCAIYENYSSLFQSKRVLYNINLGDMHVERVFSVRNANSTVFFDSGTVYFTYPDSWINSNLVYGSHTWYSSVVNAKKEAWNKLCRNSAEIEQWTTYFQTIDGVYCCVQSEDTYGSCELKKYDNGQYIPLITVENARPSFGHSFVIFNTPDQLETQSLKIYDIKGMRLLNMPYANGWFPEIIIFENKLYYTTDNKVLCYNIGTEHIDEIYASEIDTNLSLCCDGSSLVIIEELKDGNIRVHTFSIADNRHMKSVVIPSEFRGAGTYIVVDGVLLRGTDSSDKVLTYNIDAETGCFITLRK